MVLLDYWYAGRGTECCLLASADYFPPFYVGDEVTLPDLLTAIST